jgi:hypothetical protein
LEFSLRLSRFGVLRGRSPQKRQVEPIVCFSFMLNGFSHQFAILFSILAIGIPAAVLTNFKLYWVFLNGKSKMFSFFFFLQGSDIPVAPIYFLAILLVYLLEKYAGVN